MAKSREEAKALREASERDFERNSAAYEAECFDTTSIYYLKMLDILNSTVNRELKHEAGYELHHRIPRSFFNKKGLMVVDKNNLYKLTYAQHFLVHYYAYMCATKLMKGAMNLALLEMKKMCTKVDGFTEEHAVQFSRAFDSVKLDLFRTTNQKDLSIKYWRKKFDKKGLLVNTVTENKGDIKLNSTCQVCGATYEHSTKLESCKVCKGSINAQEDEMLVWFAIDLRTDKAVWLTTNVKSVLSTNPFTGSKYRYLYRIRPIFVATKDKLDKLPKAREYNL